MFKKKLMAVLLALGVTVTSIDPVSVTAANTNETTKEETKSVQTGDQTTAPDSTTAEPQEVTEDGTGTSDLAKWTIEVYLCGADLESGGGAATIDIIEMLKAKGIDSEKVNIVIETGGSKKWFMGTYDEDIPEQICSESNIDASKIQRYHIEYDGGEYGILKLDTNENSQKTIDIENGVGNMGDQAEFTDFLEYCDQYYPAEHTAVVLWNHGGGSIGGVCFDENTEGDSLSLMELRDSFSKEQADMGVGKHDLIGFDACLMGSFETDLAIAPYGTYMVGSQNVEPGDGWYYTDFLEALGQNTDTFTGEELGENIISAYETYYGADSEEHADGETTLSLYDMTYAEILRQNFDQMAKELTYIVNDMDIRSGMNNAIKEQVMELDSGADMCDLIQFLDCTMDYLTAQKNAIDDLRNNGMDLADTKNSTYRHIEKYLDHAQTLHNYLVKDSDTDTEATVKKNYSGHSDAKYVNCKGISFYYPSMDTGYSTTAVDDVYVQLGISDNYANYAYTLAYAIDGLQTFQGDRRDFVPYYDANDRIFKLNTSGKNIESVDSFRAYENVTVNKKTYLTCVSSMYEQKTDLYTLVPDGTYFTLGKTPIYAMPQDGYYYTEGTIDDRPFSFYIGWDDDGKLVVTDIFDQENQEYFNCLDGFGDAMNVGSRITLLSVTEDGDDIVYDSTPEYTITKETTCNVLGTICTIPDLKINTKDAIQTGGEKTYQFALLDRKGNSYKLSECRYTRLLAFGSAKVSLTKGTSYTYTGKDIRPAVQVKSGKVTFKAGSDYTVTYKNNRKLGKATIVVKGINDCAGISYKKTFKIKAISMKAKEIKVSKINTQLYTGKLLRPAVRMRYGKKYLTEGKDYKVTYQNNKKVGTATVTITGKGVYAGSIKTKFKIIKRR